MQLTGSTMAPALSDSTMVMLARLCSALSFLLMVVRGITHNKIQIPGGKYQLNIPLENPPRLKAKLIIPPHVTCVVSPSPIKLTEASVSIHCPTDKIYFAHMTSDTLGKICFSIIRHFGTPNVCNDSIKGAHFTCLVLALTALAVEHHPNKEMDRITF